MSVVIRIRDIWMLSMHDKYIVEYDPNNHPGGMLLCEEIPTRCHVKVTDDIAQAKRFPSVRDAMKYCEGPLSTVGRTFEVMVNGKFKQCA